MIFVSIEDFFEKVSALSPLTRAEELDCAAKMKAGSPDARERLLEGYLPFVAARIRHTRAEYQTLGLVLYCTAALEKAVDSFNFFQESEPFTHHLSWALRQAVTRYIAK